jgi:hypothetical protein
MVGIRREAELMQRPLDAVLLQRDSSSRQQHPLGTGPDKTPPAVDRLAALVQRHMPALVCQEPIGPDGRPQTGAIGHRSR